MEYRPAALLNKIYFLTRAMRVIGGKAKGTRLLAVPGDDTRPILDRVKTALFDILRPDLPGARLLDLFAGTGAVGIEALSQGAEHCVFTELGRKAVDTIKHNLELTHLAADATVLLKDAFAYLRTTPEKFDFIYAAPPQYRGIWIEAVRGIEARPEILAAGGKVIVQIDPKEYEKLELREFSELRQKKYGSTLLVFFGRG